MKTFIYIILTLLSFSNITAQETIIPLKDLGVFDEEPNTIYYYKDIDNDLDKFTGNWTYSDGNITFIAIIHKITHQESGGTFYDDIYIKLRFVENGQVIYDNLNETNYDPSDVSGANLDQNELNHLGLTYREPSNIPVTSIPTLKLEYIPCQGISCEELIWKNTYLKETADEPWPFVIPTNMVLTRQ